MRRKSLVFVVLASLAGPVMPAAAEPLAARQDGQLIAVDHHHDRHHDDRRERRFDRHDRHWQDGWRPPRYERRGGNWHGKRDVLPWGRERWREPHRHDRGWSLFDFDWGRL